MDRNRSRQDLVDDIYMTLGRPVVRVNLTDDQVNKAIDTSIKVLWRLHHDFSFENFYAYQATADDVTKGYFVIPERFDAVTEVLPRSFPNGDMYFTNALWNIQRETMNSTLGYYNINLVDYVAMRQRYYNLQSTMGGYTMPETFVRLQRRVIPQFKFNEGEMIVMRVNELIDAEAPNPSTVTGELLWDHPLLKRLAVGNAKLMWGNILNRFKGMTLPGNVLIDGDALMDQGQREIDEVMQELDGETVVPFLMG